MKYLLLAFAIIFTVYLPWFGSKGTLSSGDWPYLFPQNITEFKIPTQPPFLWLDSYYQITAKIGVQLLGLPWSVTERIFWFYPFLLLSLFSSILFLKYLAQKLDLGKNQFNFISVGTLIFATNTYILMLIGGGQLGISMGYSLIPLALYSLFSLFDAGGFLNKKLVICTLVLGIQLMFEPRFFLISTLVAFFYGLFSSTRSKTSILKKLLAVVLLAFILNLFWILPNFGSFNGQYVSATDALTSSFLSFATFSNSISLLQPNWPENIFGKVGFMRPEFLILPLIAFASLALVKKNKVIIFFVFLGLFGAFLAKGTNPPFGETYTLMGYIPGFMLFRDPTKFYSLVVVSFMILIPYSLYRISQTFPKIGYTTICVAFLFFWSILIRPAITQDLTGTFMPRVIPKEYNTLETFIINQHNSFKTLWIPVAERFGYSSRNNPAISSLEFFKVTSLSDVLSKIDSKNAESKLKNANIKYVIVPYDYLGEIFITDRKFDNSKYLKTEQSLERVKWLQAISGNFGKIKVFEVR